MNSLIILLVGTIAFSLIDNEVEKGNREESLILIGWITIIIVIIDMVVKIIQESDE